MEIKSRRIWQFVLLIVVAVLSLWFLISAPGPTAAADGQEGNVAEWLGEVFGGFGSGWPTLIGGITIVALIVFCFANGLIHTFHIRFVWLRDADDNSTASRDVPKSSAYRSVRELVHESISGLETMIVLLPLLGFTGTVWGIINSMRYLDAENTVESIRAGLETALFTTLFGLMARIVLQFIATGLGVYERFDRAEETVAATGGSALGAEEMEKLSEAIQNVAFRGDGASGKPMVVIDPTDKDHRRFLDRLGT